MDVHWLINWGQEIRTFSVKYLIEVILMQEERVTVVIRKSALKWESENLNHAVNVIVRYDVFLLVQIVGLDNLESFSMDVMCPYICHRILIGHLDLWLLHHFLIE